MKINPTKVYNHSVAKARVCKYSIAVCILLSIFVSWYFAILVIGFFYSWRRYVNRANLYVDMYGCTEINTDECFKTCNHPDEVKKNYEDIGFF